MLEFKHVNVRNAARLDRYYKNCTYRLCEYSVGVKLMWRQHFTPMFAEAGDCLIVRNQYHGRVSFDYPVPLTPGGSVEAALGDGHKHLTESEAPNKAVARKSIVAARPIRAGEVFTADNLTTKRPGDGISPMRWYEVLGKTAPRDFAEDEKIEL